MKPAKSPATKPLADLVSIDDLDRAIVNLATRINAETYELLVLVRQFDERAGWTQWGSGSCAEWLAWRCDLSMATAREKVRVAHALKLLPKIAELFSTGELSYSKVRELSRVANRNNEQDLVNFALRHTAMHVAERCRELRMGDASSINIAERALANRSLHVRRDANRGMMTVTVDLPLEAGELIDKALDKARDDEALVSPDLVDTAWSKRQADAFVTLLMEYLSGDVSDGRSNSDNYLVTIHVDQSALVGSDGRSALPIESVKRLCCDSQAVVLTENKKGEPLSIGRKSRIIPTAIQRAVRARDNNRCTFPGCNNHRFLHCHHVEHWSSGGETELDNLMLLCSKHHTLVHEGGFRIDKNFQDEWTFLRPDGIAVPDAGYSLYDPPRGGLLSVAEKSVSDRDPARRRLGPACREPTSPTYWH